MTRFVLALLALPTIAGALVVSGLSSIEHARTASASAASTAAVRPAIAQDVKASSDPISGGATVDGPDPIQDYVQPDTESEPSIAVNPKNPKNVVAVFQDRRIADGGDATNGFATSLAGGKTWTTG